jgi:membrane associated rhomboid family serine protease
MIFALPLRDNAPGPRIPYVTLALILVNTLVYLAELSAPGGPLAVIAEWGLTPARLDPITFFTSTYLHFDLLHLLSNMLILWLLGDAIEWLCGPWKFLLFYTLCGITASIMLFLLGGLSELAGAGASGAIAGVMGAYLLHFPRARITCYVLIWIVFPVFSGLRNISALWFCGAWIVQQFYSSFVALSVLEPGPYGVIAHAAGAGAGMGLIYLLRIPHRAPGRDHPLRSGRLSTIIIGDEGDAGTGRAPRLLAHEARAAARVVAMSTPFDPEPVQRLIRAGDLLAAEAFAEMMLSQAEADFNERRVAGYLQLLAEIAQLKQSQGSFF